LRLAAHLARAADDIGETFAASLATFEANKAFDHTEKAVLSGSCSTSTVSLSIKTLGLVLWRLHGVHAGGGLRLGLNGGLGRGLSVHVD